MRIRSGFALFVSGTIIASVAQGASVIQPDVAISATHTSRSGPATLIDNTAGAEVDARLRYVTFDDRGEFVVLARVRATEFDERLATEEEEQQLQFDWRRRSQKGSISSRFGYSRQDLFSSELRDFDIELTDDFDFAAEDSGVIDRETTRERLYFNGALFRDLTERTQFVALLGYRDISFDDDTGISERVDFTNGDASVGARWRVSQRSSLRVTAGVDRYDGDNGVTVDSIDGELRYGYSPTERTSLYAAVGYVTSDSEVNSAQVESADNLTFDVGGEREYENGRLRLNAYQTLRPTGGGQVLKELGVGANLRHAISERLTVMGGVIWFTSESLDTDLDDRTRDYLSARLRLAWSLSRKWSIELGYRRIDQDNDFGSSSGTDTQDRIWLSVRFRGLDPRSSR